MYNNIFSSYIDEDLGKQLSKMFHLSVEEHQILKVHVKKTQIQKGFNSCGYFALAYATALCFNEDIDTLIFDENKMIDHYLRCIRSRHVTMFPILGHKMPEYNNDNILYYRHNN